MKLNVPYFTQPTNDTCQSSVLKMMATYYDSSKANLDIEDIKKKINSDPRRPVTQGTSSINNHLNMAWWLNEELQQSSFICQSLTNKAKVVQIMINCLNTNNPVLVSTSHARVASHVILVIGYENYFSSNTSSGFTFIVHDPYGDFHPDHKSNLFRKRRYDGGQSFMQGGENGPGRNLRYDEIQIGRSKIGDVSFGLYNMIHKNI